MRRRRGVVLLLLLLAALVSAGCWDRRELEETGFVLAVGVDKGDKSRYAVTAVIAIPAKMAGGKGGGGGDKEKPVLQTTVEAPTVAGAISLIDSYLDRRISFLHTKALFMAEDLARESGLTTMDEFVRFRQARRTIFYIVTKGKASAFLKKMDVQLEKDPQRFIEQMTYNYRATGMIPAASQIQSFVTSVNTGYTQPITYYAALKEQDSDSTDKGEQPEHPEDGGFTAGEIPRKGGPNLELFGAAAFRHDKMVGVLTGEEVRYILLLQDKFQRGSFNIPDPRSPGEFVSLDVRRGRPMGVQVDLSGDRPRLTVMITLEAEILAMQPGIDYTEPEFQPRLEAAAEAEITSGVRSLIRKTQDWNADVIGFGSAVVKEFPTIAAWDSYRWPDRYRDADIRINVRMTLRRFGLQLSPPKAAR